jgi:hypothetical protein
MKASELIRELQRYIDQYGDLTVEVGKGGSYGATDYAPVESVNRDYRDRASGLEQYLYLL